MTFTPELYKQAIGKTRLVTVVSAYVPIPDHPRSEAEYDELGERLFMIDHRVLFTKGDLQHCWLYDHLKREYDLDTAHFSYSIADNPKKNSLWYHIVQAQKTLWLRAAASIDPFSDVFVWIDYGIFHVPGVTARIIDSFLDRVENERAIAIPGCWEKDKYSYNDNYPYWRFCGGVMVVPRELVFPFDIAFREEYVRWLDLTRNVSWEVNALARLEGRDPGFPVWWYKADHDSTLFTNYLGAYTDGKQAQAVRGIETRHC